ncbi:unnamed protein product [Plutella xylostella]|uniref:(diamondback moth) hypothetical protein n=1 Tax=Plutella xylostella TaxID=51655 RepID=A0A8S4FVP0_PLUXY|nr:unnamed protein product [Plutella xylostella]
MGYYCTVPQCTSLAGKTKNVKFHRFPRDVTMADKWNVILKRMKPYTKYSKVCSLHFTQADYNVTTMGQWKTLSKDAVPSQNLPRLHPDGTVMVIRKSRTVKFRDGSTKKDGESHSDKTHDKWPQTAAMLQNGASSGSGGSSDGPSTSSIHDAAAVAYRLQSLANIANSLTQQVHQSQQMAAQNSTITNSAQPSPPNPGPQPSNSTPKPRKQDAIMQTDPLSEEEENKLNASYSDSEHSFQSERVNESYPQTATQYQKETENYEPPGNHDYEIPKDYTKSTNDDYIQNEEAEKFAMVRKPHYDKPENGYPKYVPGSYSKEMCNTDYNRESFQEKHQEYPRQEVLYGYQNGYPDPVEILKNQQHNLQILQGQHRVAENQNFFNENHIKQEIDLSNEDEKYMYERGKDMEGSMYSQRRLLPHPVKTEPDPLGVCDNGMPPQNSPYYQMQEGQAAGGFYEQFARQPGPELLIAKQNALAAQTHLWQNTMKRPFFYSENPHYVPGSQLIHRYEDLTRILQ